MVHVARSALHLARVCVFTPWTWAATRTHAIHADAAQRALQGALASAVSELLGAPVMAAVAIDAPAEASAMAVER